MNSLKNLKLIYPPLLVSIALLPDAIGIAIDYTLFDSRHILIALVWLPLFTILSLVFKSKLPYKIGAWLYFVFGTIEILHWIIIKGPLTVTSILVIANTNFQESIEFMYLKSTLGLIVLIPWFLLFIYTIRKAPDYKIISRKYLVIIIVFAFSSIFILENAVNGRLVRKGAPNIIKVAFSFSDQLQLYSQAKEKLAVRNISSETSLNFNKQTFVLIMGESCNRNHMSLYGAGINTNPLLNNRDDIIKYTDVVSAYSNTINSILGSLSESNLVNKKSIDQSYDVFDVFASAGFKTYWISNQIPMGIWENLVTVFSSKSDYINFVNTSSNSSMEATLTTSFDSKLLAPLAKVLNDSANKQFIVLHLMGSHTSYKKRYPNRYNLFKGNNKQEKVIASYRNSILYNDFIVDSIFNIIEAYSKDNPDRIVSSIYLSDHGENVYDEQDRVGHDYSNKLPKANVEIPFLVWLSKSYQEKYALKTQYIHSNSIKPFITDDLFHSIIDLNGIITPIFENERSVFSKDFNDKRLRILVDGKSYD